MNATVFRTITIRGTSEGLDKLQRDLVNLAKGHKDVAIAAEETDKSTRRLEQSWKQQTLRLDEAARAANNIARESKIVNQMLHEQRISAEQAGERINLINQYYTRASTATKGFASANDNVRKSVGLTTYEMLNLNRQIADIGVSLQAGQSPFTVLVQQGTQVLDIYQNMRGTVAGAFQQGISWAGRLAGSVAGITTAVVGTTAAVGYMASSFASAQKEIDKVLSGVGAAAGTSRGGINRIAEGAAGGGMSIAEARQTALTFAATGKIYEQNIASATNVTRELARAMGIDTADAAKQLAAALVDPSKGALDLNKQLGFLDATTLNYIRTLQSQGKLQEAQNALMVAAAPAIGKQAQQVSLMTRAWNAATKALDDFDEANARAMARSLERLTGADLGGFSDEERLAGARQAQQSSQQALGRGLGLGPRAIEALAAAAKTATVEVDRLEKKLADAAKASADQRFNQLQLAADAFARALVPAIDQVNQLTSAIDAMERAKAGRGGAADPNQEGALKAARMQLAIAEEGVGVETRKAEVFAKNALNYDKVSATTAQTLASMKDQLGVAQAVTGQAQIEAQHRATTNALLAQGKTLIDAIAVADAQRAISIAQANTAADQMLKTLQQEGQLIRASSDEERDRIKAYQTYQKLVEDNVDSTKAAAVASQQLSNANETRWRAEAQAAEAAVKSIRTAEDAWNAYAQGVISWSVANQEAGKAAARLKTEITGITAAIKANNAALQEATKFVPFGTTWAGMGGTGLGTGDSQFKSNQGGVSQFNPAGYTSNRVDIATMLQGWQESANQIFGPGGWQEKRSLTGQFGSSAAPNQQGFAYQIGQGINRTIEEGLTGGVGYGGIIGQLLGPDSGLASTNPLAVQNTAQMLSRLTNLLPEDQQAGSLQGQIDLLQRQPVTLARDELIKSLTDQLKQLTDASKENTDALRTSADPLFSQGHEYLNSLRIGYYKAATGLSGIVGGSGGTDSTPVHMMLTPGEHVQVTPAGGRVSNDNSKNVTQNITQNIVINTTPADRLTGRQRAQGFLTAATRAAG